jgi:ABC-type Zn uptake system ZnuABC Zn-binding protein ZnuA
MCIWIVPSHAQNASLSVVTTTTIIADIARNVGGDLVIVTSLVPPDADSHAFEPRPSDIVRLTDADIVLANGLGLETFLGDLLATADITPVIVTEAIAARGFESATGETADNTCVPDESADEAHEEDEHRHGECDPHVWGNPIHVMTMVDNIAAAFAEADPENAEIYHANAENYQMALADLDMEIEKILSVIPEDRRLLVTNHEFLGYFADHYDFTIIGTVIPGVSTLAEPNPRELAALGDQIKEAGVPAIFVEVTNTSRLSDILAAEGGDAVQVVTLYSESLSADDGPAPTYIDYMLYNAHAIADALARQ